MNMKYEILPKYGDMGTWNLRTYLDLKASSSANLLLTTILDIDSSVIGKLLAQAKLNLLFRYLMR